MLGVALPLGAVPGNKAFYYKVDRADASSLRREMAKTKDCAAGRSSPCPNLKSSSSIAIRAARPKP